jgi:hypothetical protein
MQVDEVRTISGNQVDGQAHLTNATCISTVVVFCLAGMWLHSCITLGRKPSELTSAARLLLVGVAVAGSKRSEMAEADLLPNAMPSRPDAQPCSFVGWRTNVEKPERRLPNGTQERGSSAAPVQYKVWPQVNDRWQRWCLSRPEAVPSIPCPKYRLKFKAI